jgi:hypothetical protein
MIIAGDSRFAAVVIHSRIRVEIKHKAQGKTQNGIDPCHLLRDGGIDNEGVIANPGCCRRSSRQAATEWRPSPAVQAAEKFNRAFPTPGKSNSIVTTSSVTGRRVRQSLFDLVFELESEDL